MNGRVEPNPIMPVGNGSRSAEAGQEPNRAFGKQQIKERAQSMAEERKEIIARGIDSVGAAFRKTGEQLKNDDQGNLSQYVEMLGDKVSEAARYLRERDPRDLTHEVENFARRQPAIFLGGAFAIGFIAARFLKSSAANMSVGIEAEPEFDTSYAESGYSAGSTGSETYGSSGYGGSGYGGSGYGGGSSGGMPQGS